MFSPGKRNLFLLGIPLLIGTPPAMTEAQPDWVGQLEYRPSEVFPIRLEDHGFPEVPVLLNGERFHLVFDTGNMMGLTLPPEINQRLSLPKVGTNRQYDAAGNLLGTHSVHEAREVQFSGKTWNGVSVHEEWRENLSGLLGPRFVMERRFTIDYRSRRMAVADSSFPESTDSAESFPMVVSPRHEGLILIRGSVEGREILIQVDTGKSRTVVDPALVDLLNLPEVPHGRRIREIRLGSHTFSARSAKVGSFRGISGGLPEPILLGLGSDFLAGVLFSVDYRHRKVFLGKLMD